MASSYIYCEKCGVANPSNAKFCRYCKEPLSSASTSIHVPFRNQDRDLARDLLLKQRYRILNRLGQGGMGSVYKAEDIQLGMRPVAVKEMSATALRSQSEFDEATEAFKREALMLANLKHPYLPHIYDYFTDSGYWYLVMDFIKGETLSEHLNKTRGGRLPIDEVVDIGLKLCVVLHYLHAQAPPIVFRDLKPDNVMLAFEGYLYLIDFGIARHFKKGQTNDTTRFVSWGYSPPEQFQKGQTSPRSDIYSLGATLHQLLSGHSPALNAPTTFDFPSLQTRNRGIPPELEKLVTRMLDVEASKRPASMDDVKQELQRIVVQRTRQKNFLPPSDLHQSALLERSISEIELHHSGLVWSVAWSRDGTRLTSGGEDKTVQLWNMGIGESLLTYRGHAPDEVRAVTWSADGKRIASGGWDKTVQVWETTTGKKFLTYHGHTDYVRAVTWSAEGARIASAGRDKTVQVWDATSGSHIYTFSAHADVVNAVAWSPDGTCLASASHDKTVWVWDTITGSAIFTYTHSSSVYGVAWSPNGRYIASCSEDKTVQVWDVTTERRVFTYSGHSNWVFAVAWSPDSKHLISASKDKTVLVWVAATGKIINQYFGLTDQLYAVAWSSDRKRIAYSDGKTVQVKLVEEDLKQVLAPVNAQITPSLTQTTEAPAMLSTDDMGITSIERDKIVQEMQEEKSLKQVPMSTSVQKAAPSTVLFPGSQLSEGSLKDFFIIYHSADRSWANWIAWQLEDAGYPTILPIYSFRSDSNFENEIQKATAKARRIIVVLSPDYLNALQTQSVSVNAFRRLVINEQDQLMLICVRECRRKFRTLLESINCVDLVEIDEATAYTMLLEGVRGKGHYTPTVRPVFPGDTKPSFPNKQLTLRRLSAGRDVNNLARESTPQLTSLHLSIKGIEIFCSYAHKDEKLRRELEKRLIHLKRQGLIAHWSDRDIDAGTRWKYEIDKHLSTANIILLLISPDFMVSDYCYNIEMKRALERHEAGEAYVIPIILRPCTWTSISLGNIQVLPRGGKPVTRWPNRDEAFLNIVQSIEELVKKLTSNS